MRQHKGKKLMLTTYCHGCQSCMQLEADGESVTEFDHVIAPMVDISSASINIILDESDPTSPTFVEIETSDGKSIRIGTRAPMDSSLTKLIINVQEIVDACQAMEANDAS